MLTTQARHHALGDIPRRTAKRYPHKLAIADGETRFTFAEFEAIVDRTAAALHAAGMTKGDRLALLSRNCWQYAVLNFATARLGVLLVPINFMLRAEEIAFILDHSEASGFVAQDALIDTANAAIAAAAVGKPRVKAGIATSGGKLPEGWLNAQTWFDHQGAAPRVSVLDDDPVRIMYTSGTESRPKGALLSSRSLMWQYVSCIIDGGMDADDIEVHSMPLYHCAQLDCFLGPDIYLGATSLILPAPDAATLLRTIERDRVTKLFCPPTIWIALLRAPQFESTDLSSLRKGYYGASPMPVEVLREIQRRLPNVQLWNLYGQTEMSPVATILGPKDQLSHAGSAGIATLNVETQIVDDNDRPLPPGTVGEIVHRSPHAMLGYYKDEAKTNAAFANGWFHSGDLGYLDDSGQLRVVDRKKDMIKSGGENVASREVEEAVYLLDGVAEVAVFGIAHPRWIEAVVAVVVPKAGATLTPDDVLRHARQHLAGYKSPKYVVIAQTLPKNPSGKILKRSLRETYAGLGAE